MCGQPDLWHRPLYPSLLSPELCDTVKTPSLPVFILPVQVKGIWLWAARAVLSVSPPPSLSTCDLGSTQSSLRSTHLPHSPYLGV